MGGFRCCCCSSKCDPVQAVEYYNGYAYCAAPTSTFVPFSVPMSSTDQALAELQDRGPGKSGKNDVALSKQQLTGLLQVQALDLLKGFTKSGQDFMAEANGDPQEAYTQCKKYAAAERYRRRAECYDTC